MAKCAEFKHFSDWIKYKQVIPIFGGSRSTQIDFRKSADMRAYAYYGSALFLFTHKIHCLQTFEHMSAHWAIKGVCEVSYTYLLGCLKY